MARPELARCSRIVATRGVGNRVKLLGIPFSLFQAVNRFDGVKFLEKMIKTHVDCGEQENIFGRDQALATGLTQLCLIRPFFAKR